ncbi:hypothetical protein BCV71DRAFT_234233 [Rhizopus microsporus]|uniref:MULE transposase domain-containing protein n=1 Tax=Rhizopus microsporus TaxID=58291 RepID=A0A1X0S4W6_RHIZD|nr:hypothetical protein BCV71DRAFT_234233 [Rhizopus microsporus]
MYSVLQRIFSTFLCLQMSKKPSFSGCKKDTIQEVYVLRCIEHFAYKMKFQQAFLTGNYNVFTDNDYDSLFTFGFCLTWQASLLAKTKDFSLDTMHNTTAFKDSRLYTLVIRHAETGTGCPAAFLFTTDRSFLAFSDLIRPMLAAIFAVLCIKSV